jgi:hypothetical protein
MALPTSNDMAALAGCQIGDGKSAVRGAYEAGLRTAVLTPPAPLSLAAHTTRRFGTRGEVVVVVVWRGGASAAPSRSPQLSERLKPLRSIRLGNGKRQRPTHLNGRCVAPNGNDNGDGERRADLSNGKRRCRSRSGGRGGRSFSPLLRLLGRGHAQEAVAALLEGAPNLLLALLIAQDADDRAA